RPYCAPPRAQIKFPQRHEGAVPMHNLFDLTGKVALVTGGNGGIGIGMAEGLAQHGASVVIWGTNAAKNAQALERLKTWGGTVRAAKVDVSDEAAVTARLRAIVQGRR